MADKDQIIKEKAEHRGIFDFPAFYAYANATLTDWGYSVVEEKYSEKVSGNSREITVEWKATRGLSDYFKIEVFIRFVLRGLTDVEVEMEGKKKKMNQGTIEAEIKGSLIRDPESKWESTPFYRFLKDLYVKYVIPARIDTAQDEVRSDVQTYKEQLKSFLALSGKRDQE